MREPFEPYTRRLEGESPAEVRAHNSAIKHMRTQINGVVEGRTSHARVKMEHI